MKTLSLIALAAALTLVGCSSPNPSEAPSSAAAPSGGLGPAGGSGATAAIRHFPVHGKVLAVDAAAKKARIDAGAIGDWMGPMTMNFPIKDDAGFAQLKAGVELDATVNVTPDDDFWLTDIKVAK
ncbi:MAG TPA: copper-binding protein [Bryobacteraceae bacterium]|nr:copper-binding protein [Bryobacteraceae bacterium]